MDSNTGKIGIYSNVKGNTINKPYEYDMVNHPSHYKNYDVETIEMIAKIWGPFAASEWSELNGFKYRMRVGTKPNNPVQQDLEKEIVYLKFMEKYDEIWKNIDPYLLYQSLTEKQKEFILRVCDYVKEEKENI